MKVEEVARRIYNDTFETGCAFVAGAGMGWITANDPINLGLTTMIWFAARAALRSITHFVGKEKNWRESDVRIAHLVGDTVLGVAAAVTAYALEFFGPVFFGVCIAWTALQFAEKIAQILKLKQDNLDETYNGRFSEVDIFAPNTV